MLDEKCVTYATLMPMLEIHLKMIMQKNVSFSVNIAMRWISTSSWSAIFPAKTLLEFLKVKCGFAMFQFYIVC